MARFIPLFQFLQDGPPVLSIDPSMTLRPHPNTTNPRYGWRQIRQVGDWPGFNVQTVMRSYWTVLANAQITASPMPRRARYPIHTENVFKTLFSSIGVESHADEALERTFEWYLQNQPLDPDLFSDITFGPGDMAAVIDRYLPDLSFAAASEDHWTRPNRAPGDLKPSFKWSTRLRFHPDPRAQREFKQALSQVNFYMNQHRTMYGFICTNEEFVAIKKVNRRGHLLISQPIPWAARGSMNAPVMTVLLALWYIGMLTSHNTSYIL